MIGSLHGSNFAFLGSSGKLPELEGHLQGNLYRARPVVRKKTDRQFPGRNLSQFSSKPGCRRMSKPEISRVRKAIELSPKGLFQVGIVVAANVSPKRSGSVEVTLALHVNQPISLASFDLKMLRLVSFRSLSEWVPCMSIVPFIQGGSRRSF